MDFSINAFKQVASASWFNNAITLNKTGDGISSKFFGGSSKDTNVSIMATFKSALIEEYGVFGQNAFDSLITEERAKSGQSLRKSDVLKIINEAKNNMELVRGGLRAVAEPTLTKIFTNDPDLSRLSSEGKAEVRTLVLKQFEAELQNDDTVRDLRYAHENNTARFEEFLRELALNAMHQSSEEVLDLDD